MKHWTLAGVSLLAFYAGSVPAAQAATYAGTLYYSTFCDVVGTGSHAGNFNGCPAAPGGKRVHSINFSYTAPGTIA